MLRPHDQHGRLALHDAYRVTDALRSRLGLRSRGGVLMAMPMEVIAVEMAGRPSSRLR
jgi:hypothetical protein